MAESNANELMEKLVSLCKRRGFIFPSSEIYGGINGFWDYGPLGVELKRHIKNAWWEDMVLRRDDVVGIDSSIIMNPKVWEASGHLVSFNDPLVDCRGCKARFRADKVFTVVCFVQQEALFSTGVEADNEEQAILGAVEKANSKTRRFLVKARDPKLQPKWEVFRADKLPKGSEALCPLCGQGLTDARKFNMMFKTFVGAMEDSSSAAYLRPETAQGIFCNFRNVLDTTRLKIPFGIAQIGKSFRNEINPRNYTFRSREFEQIEIEFFCHPTEADKWYEYWRDQRFQWYVGLGLRSDRLRLRDHQEEELAHYCKACADVEYAFPFGIAELEGIANRTDFDLTQHQKSSGRDMTYFDDESKERYIPYVIEPSGGVDRAALAFLCEAYCEDTAPDEHGNPQPRTVMKLHPRLAPIKAAVFPLVKKDGMPEVALKIHQALRAAGLASFYDEKGAVGRRYRRQDEAGTPFCFTVDGQTLQDQSVTVRDRDSLVQVRIAANQVVEYVQQRIR
ncbi:MAG: glycine--tRNA ligase [Phycisphaerae bacterium]|nr:glycine--tRNA ligase [Phycisphaerae bacterium]